MASRAAESLDVALQRIAVASGKVESFDVPLQRIAMLGGSRARVVRPVAPPARTPTVSVVVPCYNYSKYLRACIESATTQPGVDVEVLILDDGSSDGSADIARELARSDSRVHAIVHDRNIGHIATYNEGLAQAGGDYTMLISADDLLTPGALARATTLMEAEPSVGLVYGYAAEFSGESPPPARTDVRTWCVWAGEDWIYDRCASGRNALRSPEALIRTAVQREIGGYRPDLPHSGDLEMWMRAATVSDIGLLAGVDQAFKRIHADNMSLTRYEGMLTDLVERRRAFDEIVDRYRDQPRLRSTLRERAHVALAREALRHAMNAFDRGYVDQAPIESYVEFALDTWPGVRAASEWPALERRQRLGAAQAARAPRYQLEWRARKARSVWTESMRPWTGRGMWS